MARKHIHPPVTLRQLHEAICALTSENREIFQALSHKVHHMLQSLTDLTADVAQERTVINSAVTLIQGLPDVIAAAVKAALDNAGIDSAAIDAAVQAVRTEVQSQTSDLSAAVVAGTGTKLPTP